MQSYAAMTPEENDIRFALRQSGYQIPEVTRVGRKFAMPGGRSEMQFPYPIPPEFTRLITP